MSQELKVAIIDDDRLSSHNWNILLKFVGEDPLMLTGENWQRELISSGGNGILAVMVGSLMESRFNDNAIVELVEAIHEWNGEVPIFLNFQKNALENLPEVNNSTIFELPDQSDYQSLLKVLVQARKSRGFDDASLESDLISSSGTAMFRSLVGESDVMQQTRELMLRVADKKVNVLVLGEPGTGKEIMARNLHYHSGRGEEAFVIVNCAFISHELFGHDAGFNGSTEIELGLFEMADEGTIFFDEISDMSMETQARLLRFLETRSFERQGGRETIRPDVRVIAASNKNLEEIIADGMFREDLYYRLSVVPIKLPALRDHAEDIPDLIGELISRLEHESNHSVRFNSSAIASLQNHLWPGNVRELANLVERLSIIQVNEVVGLSDLPVEYQHLEKQLQLNTKTIEKIVSTEETKALTQGLQALEVDVARIQAVTETSEQMATSEETRILTQGLQALEVNVARIQAFTDASGEMASSEETKALKQELRTLEVEFAKMQASRDATGQVATVAETKVLKQELQALEQEVARIQTSTEDTGQMATNEETKALRQSLEALETEVARIQTSPESSGQIVTNEETRALKQNLEALEAEVARIQTSSEASGQHIVTNEETQSLKQNLEALEAKVARIQTSTEGSDQLLDNEETKALKQSLEALETEVARIQANTEASGEMASSEETKVLKQELEALETEVGRLQSIAEDSEQLLASSEQTRILAMGLETLEVEVAKIQANTDASEQLATIEETQFLTQSLEALEAEVTKIQTSTEATGQMATSEETKLLSESLESLEMEVAKIQSSSPGNDHLASSDETKVLSEGLQALEVAVAKIQESTEAAGQMASSEETKALEKSLQTLEVEIAKIQATVSQVQAMQIQDLQALSAVRAPAPQAQEQVTPVAAPTVQEAIPAQPQAQESQYQEPEAQVSEIQRPGIEMPAVQKLQSMDAEGLKLYMKNFEKHLIQVALDDSAGMVSYAAGRLSMQENELNEKMKEHDIEPAS